MKQIDEDFFKHDTNTVKEKITIDKCLEDGEKILWKGKPKKTSYALSKCIKFLPFALIWAFIDVFIIVMITSSTDAKEMLFFIIPFFAIHLAPVWILIAKLVKSTREVMNINYAITNNRVICKKGYDEDGLNYVYWADIDNISLKRDGIDKLLHCGDIYIYSKKSTPPPTPTIFTNDVIKTSSNFFANIKVSNVTLFDIHDCQFIYSKLNEIVKDINKNNSEFYRQFTVCSHCGSYVENTLKKCPNCGAKNDGFLENLK